MKSKPTVTKIAIRFIDAFNKLISIINLNQHKIAYNLA